MIRVVSPRRTKALAARLRGENLEWCYFGTDNAERARIVEILGSANSISISEELNRIAYESRQAFADWIMEIGIRQEDKVNWWSSRLATKSPLQTDLFLLVCYHKLFRSWLGTPQSRIRVVVVEDPWLRSLLGRDFGAAPGVEVAASKSAVVANTAYWLARVPLAILYFAIRYCWLKVLAEALLSSSWPRREQTPDKLTILLYTWIEKSCFIKPDRLNDSYTGRLEEILSRNGESVTRLTSLSVRSAFLRRLKPFARSLVATQRHITIGAIFKSATAFFRITNFQTVPMLDGGNYAPLLHRELLLEWGTPAFATAQLAHQSFRRIAKHCKARVKVLIYPFENQPWEKMLCLAFRREAPEIRLIGYQHTPIPALFVSYLLGAGESRFVPLPDVIVTHGKATLDRLREGGFPEEKLVDGGALRMEYLFDQKENRRTGRTAKEEPRILVVFPTSRLSSACLLQDLLELFPAPSFTFILKCHPDLPWGTFGNKESKLPAWFTVSAQPLNELIQTVDLFLYAPPTGSWREAYIAGLPVLKYQGAFLGEFLDIETTDAPGVSEVPVASRDTLRKTVHDLLTEASDSSPLERKRFLERAFSPVNEEVWMQLVKTQAGQPLPSQCLQ